MNTRDIYIALQKNPVTSRSFRGVFAADQLPAPDKHFPTSYVANCSNADQVGSHWIAFFQEEASVIEVFDSYGKPLEYYNSHLVDFTRGLKLIRQVQILQQPMSTVCGHYCLYFLFNRYNGESYDRLIHSFTDNALINDKIVCQYVNRCFEMETKVFDMDMLDQTAKAMVKNLHSTF